MNKQFVRAFPALAMGILGVCCLAVTLITLYVLSVSHWHGPFRDMWEIYPFLVKIIQHAWTWSDLWESYGYAHRLVIPRLLFVADYQFAGASNHLLIGVSLLCQTGIVTLFALILFAKNSTALWRRGCLLLVVMIFQFSGTLLFNFMHTFDVQWFLCCLLITTAFYMLTLQTSIQSLVLCSVSGLLIVLACLCNFSAMAAWPVWMLLLRHRAIRPVFIGVLLSIVGIFILIYAVGVRSQGLSGLAAVSSLELAGYFFLQFPLLYLANPVSDPDYLRAGAWGVVLLLVPLLLLLRFWWNFFTNKIRAVDRTLLFFASLMLFCFGVALMTGLGRGYDPTHVYASRYQNIVVLFWSAVLPFIVLQAPTFKPAIRYVLISSGAFFLMGFLACQWQSWNENLLLGRNVSRAHLALMMGYSSDVPMIAATVSRSMIYVPGYHLEKERWLHEQAGKGIYKGSMAGDWRNGIRLSEVSSLCSDVEWKLRDRVTPHTRFVEFLVTGNVQGYDYALLVDKNGKAIALAEPERAADMKQVVQRLLKISPASLRGFSQSLDEADLSFVMVSSKNTCSIR